MGTLIITGAKFRMASTPPRTNSSATDWASDAGTVIIPIRIASSRMMPTSSFIGCTTRLLMVVPTLSVLSSKMAVIFILSFR
ncbi:hypothetical protein D3C87_1996740 [compost metagenome]